MEYALQSLTDVLDEANSRLRGGSHAAARVWPTGFELIDRHLGGGLRSGELILLAGPQGLGKTTLSMQVARNIALSGRSVLFFSFEHDPQTMLVRLMTLEAGLDAGHRGPNLAQVRSVLETMDGWGTSLAERLEEWPGGGKAVEMVSSYADRLVLHRSSGSSTTLDIIRDAVEEVRDQTGQLPAVFVDYLQKVKIPEAVPYEDERVTVVVEGLKDLALDAGIPVFAVVAADKEGIQSGKRMRVNHLRGSSALAYEADTVLIINNKYDVVARHHLVYDTGNMDRFKSWVVLSIEKNRSGKDGIDLEYRKRFEHARFDADGQMVAEKLVDERVFTQ